MATVAFQQEHAEWVQKEEAKAQEENQKAD